MGEKDAMQRAALHTVYECLEQEPDRGFPGLLTWLQGWDTERSLRRPLRRLQTGRGRAFLQTCWRQLASPVREALFVNLILHAGVRSAQERRCYGLAHRCTVPQALALCVSADGPDFEALDEVIEQGKAVGIYLYLFYQPGTQALPPPLADMCVALCNKHSDCQFALCTQGGSIQETLVSDMLRVKNLAALLWVNAEETADTAQTAQAFRRLQAAGLPTGALAWLPPPEQAAALQARLAGQGVSLLCYAAHAGQSVEPAAVQALRRGWRGGLLQMAAPQGVERPGRLFANGRCGVLDEQGCLHADLWSAATVGPIPTLPLAEGIQQLYAVRPESLKEEKQREQEASTL